jgi:hypothetical protein
MFNGNEFRSIDNDKARVEKWLRFGNPVAFEGLDIKKTKLIVDQFRELVLLTIKEEKHLQIYNLSAWLPVKASEYEREAIFGKCYRWKRRRSFTENFDLFLVSQKYCLEEKNSV